MENTKFIILKLITGETVVGNLIKKNRLGITIFNPLIYQIITTTTPAGQIVKQFISFRPWCEFSSEKEITFKNNHFIGPPVTPNEDLISFYSKEIELRNTPKQIPEPTEKETKSEPDQASDKVRGVLNFNMEFQNPEDLQQQGWQAVLTHFKAYLEQPVVG
jgi:hypothetical protein